MLARKDNTMTTLDIAGTAPAEAPTLGQRFMRDFVWAVADSDTALSEISLFGLSLYYGFSAIFNPSQLDRLAAFTTVAHYLNAPLLAAGALLPVALALAAYVRESLTLRRWAMMTAGGFYFGTGATVMHSVPLTV